MDKKPFIYILLSAALFGLSSPVSKLLLKDISPVALAGLLYLGAFMGLFFYSILTAGNNRQVKAPRLERKDILWLVGAILAGAVIAPISQMLGLSLLSGFSVSLLLNLEGLATCLIAILFFHENSGKRFWAAIVCMTIAGVLLSWNPDDNRFNIAGPLLILLAVICWGLDNNFTRQISDKNPVQIAWIKGLAGGIISLSVALILGSRIPLNITIIFALLLGALSYGVSLVLFIKALKGLGSSRTGAFFSLGPFIGALVSVLILREWIGWVMIPAFLLMVGGVWLVVGERHDHDHVHEAVTHNHLHRHDDLHHLHHHPDLVSEHIHEHSHEETNHCHAHWPDIQHRHVH